MGIFDFTPALLPRWAIDNAGVSSPDVDQPVAQKRTAGWLAGEKPARGFMNWIHQRTYVWLGFLEAQIQRLFDGDFVMRRGTGLSGEVALTRLGGSAPHQWQFDADESVIWYEGKAYEVAAGTVTIDTTATSPSYYLMVATTAGTVAMRTSGFPGSEPALVAGDVPLSLVVLDAATTAATLIDRRDAGAFTGGSVDAERSLRAGKAGSVWGLEVSREDTTVNMRGIVQAGFQGANDWNLTVDQYTDTITLKGTVELELVARQIAVPGCSFNVQNDVNITYQDDGTITFGSATTQKAVCGVQLPDKATITKVEVWGFGGGPPAELDVRLKRRAVGGAVTTLATVSMSGDGDYNASDSSISSAVVDNSQYTYFLDAENNAASVISRLEDVAITVTLSEL